MEKLLSKGKQNSREVSYQGKASVACSLQITLFLWNRVSCIELCSSALKGALFMDVVCVESHMPRFQPSRCFLSLNFFPFQVFLVHKSTKMQKKALSLRLPCEFGVPLKEFAIKESTYSKLSLDGQVLVDTRASGLSSRLIEPVLQDRWTWV